MKAFFFILTALSLSLRQLVFGRHPELPMPVSSRSAVLDIPPSMISFVVTRFREPLSPWTSVANRTFLYDKFGTPQTEDNVSHLSFLQYSLAPNIGHEQHTFCFHVHENYDSLSEVVVFSQAEPFHDLLSPAVNTTFEMLELASESFDPAIAPVLIFNKDLIHDLSEWGPINWSSPLESYWISPSELKTLVRAPYTLAEYWSYLFDKPHPSAVRANHGGTFATTRTALRRHPKAFYRRCLAAFESHGQNVSNGELGFFMERMDLAVLDEKFWLE